MKPWNIQRCLYPYSNDVLGLAHSKTKNFERISRRRRCTYDIDVDWLYSTCHHDWGEFAKCNSEASYKMKTKNIIMAVATLTLCSISLTLTSGCQKRFFNLAGKSSPTAEAVSRASFFSHSQLWYARVSGWDKTKIQSWEISDKSKVPGARFEIFRMPQDLAEKTWCPLPS